MRVLETAFERGRHPTLAGIQAYGHLPELSAKEREEFSFAKAIAVAAGYREGNCLEREYNDAAGRAVKGALGFLVPMDVGPMRGAALNTTTPTAGGNMVFVAALSFLDLLRAKSVAASLGATILTDALLPGKLPVQSGGTAAVWLAEIPGSDISESDATYGGVNFGLKTLGAATAYSRQLVAQTIGELSTELLVRRDLAGRIAAAWDKGSIQGSGASNEPTGLLFTSGINVVAIGTNGGAPTYSAVVDLEREVGLDNGDLGQLGFATTPGMRAKLRKLEKAAGSGVVWTENGMLGYPSLASTNVPSTLTKGTSTDCHAVVYGNWQDLVIASRGVLDLVVDPMSKKKQALVEVVAYWYGDIGLGRAESFAAIKDARDV